MTSPDAAPEATPVAPAAVASEDGAGGVAAARGVAAREPVLPEQSLEDTDAGWGEYSARDDDRLYRDRPPHWDDV
jgi:hypothetical protein